MFWRIFRIAVFMINRIFGYLWFGLQGKSRRDAYMLHIYVEWARYTLDVFNVELQAEGRNLVPSIGNAPRVFLCNHQSQLDIPVLVAALEEKVGFVAKKELGRIPLLSYWMRQVGCIFIDRSDKAGAHESLKSAAAAMGNTSLVVFPEGTRSKSGSLQSVKSGGLRMAVMAGAQIIPVRIQNSRNAFEARAADAPVPIPVQIRFFPPMNAHEGADDRSSWQKVKLYLEECWATPHTPNGG